MARTLTPWKLKSRRNFTLRGESLELFERLVKWRSLFVEDVLTTYSRGTLYRLTIRNVTYIHPTPYGEIVMLGPDGRLKAEMNPNTRSPTDSVLTAAFLSRTISELQDLGYLYSQRESRSWHWLTDLSGNDCLLVGQVRGIASRTIRTLLTKHENQMLRTGDYILVAVNDRRRSRHIAAKRSRLVRVHFTAVDKDDGTQFMRAQEAERKRLKRERDLASWHRRKGGSTI